MKKIDNIKEEIMDAKEKTLIKINEQSILYKIKAFIKKLFTRKSKIKSVLGENLNNTETNPKEKFMDYIKNTEDDDIILLQLQKQYQLGEVKEEELSKEQIDSLYSLYDRQIEVLIKANQLTLNRLLAYKNKS